ncbi:MAG: BREX protein BrxB domain-containing protein [bacterium]
MLSLKDRLELLQNDLLAQPPRISVYHDLPFAILRYDPKEEWELRREARLLATKLANSGKQVHTISLAELLWEAIASTEGVDAIVTLERQRGFEAAQMQITTYLSDKDWSPLPDLLAERLRSLDPAKDIAFILRTAAMTPAIYHMSKLLDEMQGRTRVTTILFYPGTLDGLTGLQFMDLQDREATGNYRVKIYG